MKTGFEEFAEVLKKMPMEQKQKLIAAHQEYNRLKSYCEAKKLIEALPSLTGIRVLKMTKEVKELKALIDTLQPGKFKWVLPGDEEST